MRNNRLKCKYQIIAFVLVFLVAVLSGCEKVKTTSAPSTDSSAISSEYMENQSEVNQNPTEDSTEENTIYEENKTTVTEKKNTESQISINSSEPKSQQKVTEISPLQKQETEIPTVNKPLESEPISKNAGMTDSKAISDILIKYINTYRLEQGIPGAIQLSGLTEYAEYRSQQLVTNFTHDIYDERSAATAIKYGKYIDPALWGIDEESYYTACAGEAIALGGYIGTVDYIAQSLARQVRESSSHWAYVGSAEYPYIAVGITLDSGTWYCDIAMSKTNEYEK